jgi:hypothetical protein
MTKTPFVVATPKQGDDLKYVEVGNADGLRSPMDLKLNRHRGWSNAESSMILQLVERQWIEYTSQSPHRANSGYVLTRAGELALKLREILGPDRGLTKAGAKALMKGAPTRATKIRLMDDGLWKRQYMLGAGHELAWLTEDGHRVRELLLKYDVDL